MNRHAGTWILAGVMAVSVVLPEAQAQGVTKEDVEAATNETNLRVAKAVADLTVQQKEAEARKAIAEAEKAELAAKLPTTETKLLSGSINSEKFGAASLVKAFDLAKDLARELCESVPSNPGFVIYDAATVQGIVSAKAVERELGQLGEQLTKSNEQLDTALKGDAKALWAAPILGIGAAVTGIKAAADLASVFKSNLTVVGTSYGDGSKALFTTALAEQCLPKVKGLGTGYLGELDDSRYTALREKYADLVKKRAGFSISIDQLKKILDNKNTTEADKEKLTPLYASASQLLKAADVFIESLKASEVSDKSPLFNAARYLAYEERTSGADILDFELRLEGLSITKENIFVGQRLRLSGVAFLTYRIYAPKGNIKQARTIRRITKPIEVNLKGNEPDENFWSGSSQPDQPKKSSNSPP